MPPSAFSVLWARGCVGGQGRRLAAVVAEDVHWDYRSQTGELVSLCGCCGVFAEQAKVLWLDAQADG